MVAGDGPELTISELARLVGLTERNIRAHQARGLLMPPSMRGRIGYYGPEHIARVRWIRSMQAQGFNLTAIGGLLEGSPSAQRAAQQRSDPDHLEPVSRRAPELGEHAVPGSTQLLLRAGVLRRMPDGELVAPAAVLTAASTLITLGLPAAAVVRIQSCLLAAVEQAAEVVRSELRDRRREPVLVQVLAQLAAADVEIGLPRLLAERAEE